ncbi:MAG TPA: hypothetical protein VFZ64_12440 [Nocardioidaceae bacterium]
MTASLLPMLAAPAAHAAPYCGTGPDGQTVIWRITDIRKRYVNTGLFSNWVHPQYDSAQLAYNDSATSAWTGTVSASLSAEAGVVFAKASSTISVSIAKTWSKTATWSYTMNVPKDPDHRYRMRQRQETRKFTARKFRWKYSEAKGRCAYVRVKSGWGHFPRSTQSTLVWSLQKKKV